MSWGRLYRFVILYINRLSLIKQLSQSLSVIELSDIGMEEPGEVEI